MSNDNNDFNKYGNRTRRDGEYHEPNASCPWDGGSTANYGGFCSFLTAPELRRMSRSWGPFMLLGIGLMVLGALAICSTFFTTVLTVSIIGVLLMIGGVTQIVNSLYAGKWSGFFLHIALGILYLVVGFMLIDAPILNAITLTFLLAGFFILAGLFRVVAALTTQLPGWGWALFNGMVTFVLGALIYRQWPTSGLWVIGLFVGIEMILAGWYWAMFASSLRSYAANPRAYESQIPQPQGV